MMQIEPNTVISRQNLATDTWTSGPPRSRLLHTGLQCCSLQRSSATNHDTASAAARQSQLLLLLPPLLLGNRDATASMLAGTEAPVRECLDAERCSSCGVKSKLSRSSVERVRAQNVQTVSFDVAGETSLLTVPVG